MPRAVVFDLDSTLADTTHRQHMIPAIQSRAEGAPTWDDYSMACSDDSPVASTIWLANHLFANSHYVFIVTGRNECARELTIEWLEKHKVGYSNLVMRPTGDKTPNQVFKIAALDTLHAAGFTVDLFVEDYPAVADAIREHFPQIPVLLVNPGYHTVGGA